MNKIEMLIKKLDTSLLEYNRHRSQGKEFFRLRDFKNRYLELERTLIEALFATYPLVKTITPHFSSGVLQWIQLNGQSPKRTQDDFNSWLVEMDLKEADVNLIRKAIIAMKQFQRGPWELIRYKTMAEIFRAMAPEESKNRPAGEYAKLERELIKALFREMPQLQSMELVSGWNENTKVISINESDSDLMRMRLPHFLELDKFKSWLVEIDFKVQDFLLIYKVAQQINHSFYGHRKYDRQFANNL